MTRVVRIHDRSGERVYRPSDFPLVAGGAGAGDIELPGAPAGVRVALLTLADGALYWCSESGDGTAASGAAARWLAPGDVLQTGTARLRCEHAADGLRLTVAPALAAATLPPDPDAEEAWTESGAADEDDGIAIARYRPAPAPAVRKRSGPQPRSVAIAAALAVFAAILWMLVTARAVEVVVEPAADDVDLRGGLSFALAGRWLLRPGHYTVVAQKQGYETLSAPIEVTAADNQRFSLALVKLPGKLDVHTNAPQAVVAVDGAEIGPAPIAGLALKPGDHTVAVSAPRYLPAEQPVSIAGGGEQQSIDVALAPGWAEVSLSSKPPGAELRVDDAAVGNTPLTAEVAHGSHVLELKLPGYKVWRQALTVEAGVAQNLPEVTLVKADGLIDVRSSPSGAAVTVDGRFRGETPLELQLAPGRSYRVSLSKGGYAPVNRTVQPASGEDASLAVTLEPVLGIVHVVSEPADAEVYVDGNAVGSTPQSLKLTAVTHHIDVRKMGYATQSKTITPRPGYEQQMVVALQTEQVARLSALAPQILTKLGQPLVLVTARGQLQMGASRREPGRRANETLYEVDLERPFYIGTREVTNKEFRSFDPNHLSGSRDTYSLDEDGQPVVRVSWEDAARYCNWLSTQEGLQPAYTEVNGRFFGVTPMTTGYRLPTEAEWTAVSRYPYEQPIRFPWGDEMPPPPKSGNYADQSARSTVATVIEGYDDGYPVTAPPGSFAANPLGLYDLGGNVAEWVHDLYSIEVTSGFDVLLDPMGPSIGDQHVIRGSSYLYGEVANLRLTYRDYGSDSRDDVGFRIARYAE